MGIISIIMLIVQYGPAIFHLVTEIWDLIKKLRDRGDKVSFKLELDNAVKHYRANGDRRRLEVLRDKLRNRCFGEGCKP